MVDARDLGEGTEVHTDVCIIGAGPAGITLAESWRDASFDVLLMESGNVTSATRHDAVLGAENGDDRYYRLDRSRATGFGGTANMWKAVRGVRVRPLDSIDFMDRAEIGRRGWPISAGDLDNWYARAACRMGLRNSGFDLESGSDEHVTTETINDRDVQSVLFRFAPGADYPQRYRMLAATKNITVLLNATAVELVPNQSGAAVQEVTVAATANRYVRVRPKIVVLACGGIENARLLLASAKDRGGIANRNDLVGRFFMEHPHVRTGVLKPSQEDGAVERAAFYSMRQVRGENVIGMLTVNDEVKRREGLLNSAWWLRPRADALTSPAGHALADLLATVTVYRRPVSGTGDRARTVVSHPVQSARAIMASVGRSPSPVLQLAAMAEQQPCRESRVTLTDRLDALGRPLARVQWRLSDLDYQSLRRSQQLIGKALSERGFGEFKQPLGSEEPSALIGGGFHHMGTTRMSDVPSEGVVDKNCQVHGIANLYVAGSSVFPSVGYANPTMTIVALAARLADHLHAQLTAD